MDREKAGEPDIGLMKIHPRPMSGQKKKKWRSFFLATVNITLPITPSQSAQATLPRSFRSGLMPCFVSITSSSSRQHLHHLITTSSSSLSFIKQLTTSIDRPATLRTLARRAHPAGPQIVFRHYDYDNSDEHVKEKKKKEEKNEQM